VELRDLQCFIAVAEELSFTRAALRLRVAQPALSLRIRQFEAELGAPLFERTKRKVSIADAGRALLPLARQIISSSDQAVQTVRMISSGHLGAIRIGAFYSAIYTVLPRIIGGFAEKYPSVEIQIKELIVTDQIKMLRRGEIDVGVVRLQRPDPDLQTIDLMKEKLVCAVNAQHPLARRASLSMRDLASDPVITLDPEFNAEFYAATLAAFSAHGLPPRIVKKAPDMHLVLGLVSAGLGVALVPSSLAQIGHKYIAFKPLRNKVPDMMLRLAWLAKDPPQLVVNFANVAALVYGSRRS
jgi:DNA-binding transcriptional LysR family regulator